MVTGPAVPPETIKYPAPPVPPVEKDTVQSPLTSVPPVIEAPAIPLLILPDPPPVNTVPLKLEPQENESGVPVADI